MCFSGLLLAYTCFRKMEKIRGTFNWISFWVLFYFHRFWRYYSLKISIELMLLNVYFLNSLNEHIFSSFINLTVCLSVCLSVCLFVCLSISQSLSFSRLRQVNPFLHVCHSVLGPHQRIFVQYSVLVDSNCWCSFVFKILVDKFTLYQQFLSKRV